MNENVVILTVADTDVGLGHLFRCDALAKGLKERGANSHLVVDTCQNTEWLNQKHIETDFNIAAWTTNKNEISRYLEGMDLAVFDSYNVADSVWSVISELDSTKALFDDYGEKPFVEGFLINGSPGAKYIGYNTSMKRTLLLSTDYQVLRKPFWQVGNETVKHNVDSIAVVVGGTDYKGMTKELVQQLDMILPERIKIKVVGKGHFNRGRVIGLGFLDAVKMRNLFLYSNLLVSAAGQTIAEAVSVGIPTVMIKTAENQKYNYVGWQKNGVCVAAGDINQIGFLKAFTEIVNNSLTRAERKKMNKRALQLEIHNSTMRLAGRLLGR